MKKILGMWLLIFVMGGCGAAFEDASVTPGCAPGLVMCDGGCVSFGSDTNCGACGRVCGEHSTCKRDKSQYVCECDGGYGACGGDGCTVELKDNVQHCGACFEECEGVETCENSQCFCGTLNGGTVIADSNRETVFLMDPTNCGRCGYDCSVNGNTHCESGRCTCGNGLTSCPDIVENCSVNLQIDSKHCGTCETVCADGTECRDGECRCKSGQVYCGKACVESNDAHCGDSCQKCRSPKVCLNGACQCPKATPDFCATDVDWTETSFNLFRIEQYSEVAGTGYCTNFETDPKNCGSCRHSCGSGQCVGGQCVCNGETCLEGYTCNNKGRCVCGYAADNDSVCQFDEGEHCVNGECLCGSLGDKARVCSVNESCVNGECLCGRAKGCVKDSQCGVGGHGEHSCYCEGDEDCHDGEVCAEVSGYGRVCVCDGGLKQWACSAGATCAQVGDTSYCQVPSEAGAEFCYLNEVVRSISGVDVCVCGYDHGCQVGNFCNSHGVCVGFSGPIQ